MLDDDIKDRLVAVAKNVDEIGYLITSPNCTAELLIELSMALSVSAETLKKYSTLQMCRDFLPTDKD